ncbi:Glutamate receptor, ionotropic kainate 2 [Papilio machaon]|uniref:Glutamate receptor, ionotropic kainate 2 n=1 Tax=Papilio machaon TaxID=76193 RepID=A0A194RQZ4_PAPMA|nr:Glutamate receptor, ionotropic kainate 2 [Papilio machaon]
MLDTLVSEMEPKANSCRRYVASLSDKVCRLRKTPTKYSPGLFQTRRGIFYTDSEELKAALSVSAKLYNFEISIKEIARNGTILELNRHVCELAEESVIGIIDGTGGQSTEFIQALCDILELPHVTIKHNDIKENSYILNLHPSSMAYDMVMKKLVARKEWEEFTILYLKGYSLIRTNSLLQLNTHNDRYVVTLRELNGNDYRDVLISAKESGYVNFVVDCPQENVPIILQHAQEVGLLADEHSYIFVSPDLFTLDLERYRYGGVNMTGLRLADFEENEDLWNFAFNFNKEFVYAHEADQLTSEILLIHDAVLIFSKATEKMKYGLKRPEGLSCENGTSWNHGSSLLNFMKTNKVEGFTRTLTFNGHGDRHNVIFDVLELTPAGNITIGTWNNNNLTISRPILAGSDIVEETIMKNRTFKVLIATSAPYGYVKESSDQLEGNDRYEGFTIDLIEKLSEILGFSYEFEVELEYGTKDPQTQKWNGMIYQLMEDKADFAICDFTITSLRQSAIDFSTPFMSLGIGILYKTPSKQPPEMFSFMAVFSKEVWYYMVLVQLGLGVIMIFVGRISHKEWQNPVPCIEQPEELTNQFSFANSVWLIIGSVMQQGSEIAPIALAPRMITSVWWFFTMVIVASYVGTLVAFLTVEKNVLPFETLEELYKQKSISYGAKSKGSTLGFFQHSPNPILAGMYKKMVDNHWLVATNDIGVAKCENETYAFFMESTSLEYYKERHCDLLQVGDSFDSKSYGIGMKKGSPYKKYIDYGLRKLKESGEIQKLKNIWWKEKRGGGKCGIKRDEEQKQLGLKNMLGAFVVLGVGCLIGLFISIIDMLWGVFKRTVKYNTTFKFELIEELKFALKFSGDTKPVKRHQKAQGSSDSLAEAEAKDEIKSLRSIKSGRSTDTNRTHHSHSSKHSGLSMAFAKRREYS